MVYILHSSTLSLIQPCEAEKKGNGLRSPCKVHGWMEMRTWISPVLIQPFNHYPTPTSNDCWLTWQGCCCISFFTAVSAIWKLFFFRNHKIMQTFFGGGLCNLFWMMSQEPQKSTCTILQKSQMAGVKERSVSLLINYCGGQPYIRTCMCLHIHMCTYMHTITIYPIWVWHLVWRRQGPHPDFMVGFRSHLETGTVTGDYKFWLAIRGPCKVLLLGPNHIYIRCFWYATKRDQYCLKKEQKLL